MFIFRTKQAEEERISKQLTLMTTEVITVRVLTRSGRIVEIILKKSIPTLSSGQRSSFLLAEIAHIFHEHNVCLVTKGRSVKKKKKMPSSQWGAPDLESLNYREPPVRNVYEVLILHFDILINFTGVHKKQKQQLLQPGNVTELVKGKHWGKNIRMFIKERKKKPHAPHGI